MSIFTKSTLGFATVALLATTAQAGVMDSKSEKTERIEPTPVTVQTIDESGQVGQLTIFTSPTDHQTTAVLGALAVQTTDAYIVQDNDGDLFINHLVPIEDLPDPDLDVRTVDVYTFEHNGRTYTNKIVDED